jgi:AmmeMemoRadiSam system protein A
MKESMSSWKETGMGRAINSDERRFLLRLARSTITTRFETSEVVGCKAPEGPLTEHRGAFVTLTIDGSLRGCIGHVVGVVPLWKSVQENAAAAAFRDPRFPPLGEDELDRIEIEISALSALDEVGDPSSIVVGSHGLLIERGSARGLLLPQVAGQQGWDRLTFLDHTCRKAGLERECWSHPDTRIFTFTVENFAEKR